ncbi:efflux transporter outer membrane subunit [Pseudogulbenkiania subflava]|uniref:Efflux transporter, outer membrane factor (OMF) lipoprotein, NodT family n=1 Tax=Pseudogulbenkiania subflava DSM 22618 TaxID=1123014 RepID=A0A1Y6BD85_9NEIS|nr:efflux transporter outer membrane subunit [Pseudogulbenkiania subflava]SME94731.1 efflux transporter, outer membrane factor (OMF) lipoprotein, NodT family [Pseudogulbenkiania subflava DSM 22618]
MKTSKRHALWPLAALLLGGCAVGPDYQRPAVTVPAAYKEAGDWKPATPADHLPRAAWWQAFADPQLDGLQQQLQKHNQTLRAAEASFRQALALLQQAEAGYSPTVTAGASASRGRASGDSAVATSYRAELSAAWELDLWGRVRRSVESGRASAEASAADLESTRLSAQAQLASAYFQLYVADRTLRLLDEQVAAYRQQLQITRNRYRQGVVSRADVVQAETQLKSTEVSLLAKRVTRRQLEHAIAVLLGRPPAGFTLAEQQQPPALPLLPAGLPSQLLERRPDIAAAERRVAAANAAIGVAKAGYFPSLTLAASGGYAASRLADWFSLPARFWSLGPELAVTLFNGGLTRAKTAEAIAAYDGSVANYRQTVLQGFQEVEDALTAIRLLDQQAALQVEALAAAREAETIARNQYQAGLVSYLDVVTVQSTRLSAEQEGLAILGSQLAARVALIKALGGGWQASPPAAG